VPACTNPVFLLYLSQLFLHNIMPADQKVPRNDSRRWATKEQADWLRGQIPAYLASVSEGGSGRARFWDQLFGGWFSHWPETQPETEEAAGPIEGRKQVCDPCFLPGAIRAQLSVSLP
jgi:hypothetical protein